jgi:capsular polysaccharide biosynthesis protein
MGYNVQNFTNKEKLSENHNGIFLVRNYEFETTRKITNRESIFEILREYGIKIIDPTSLELDDLDNLISKSRI